MASVIGRFFKAIPLKLVTEDGDEHKGRGIHPVLRLFNERPNEFQSATSFREMLAQEMVYTGEAVLRVHREGTTPHRIFCWPSNHVTLNQDTDWGSQLDQAIVYHYVSQSFALDPELPQVCHARLNVDPQYPLQGPAGRLRDVSRGAVKHVQQPLPQGDISAGRASAHGAGAKRRRG